jgi:dipeptidyl aminopeptidase/acylaminoacyl peptidase
MMVHIRALALATACALASGALTQPSTYAGDLHAAGQAARPASFLLVVPLQPLRPGNAHGYPVQIRRFSAAGTSQPLYRRVTIREGASIAISPDARWLAYSDATAMVHLVALAQGRDRLLGRRGAQPRFSFDGRYVAFLTGPIVPNPGGLGPQADRIIVYDTRTAARRVIMAPSGQLITGFAWAPHDERLAWQLSDPAGHVLFALGAADRPGTGLVVLRAQASTWGGLAWAPDGQGLLYWRFVGLRRAREGSLPYFALLRWTVPAGPATTLLPATPTLWGEGIPPAAVLDVRGRYIASLLGGPAGGRKQVIVFRRPQMLPRHITLPGEPRVLAFAPAGDQALVVWDALRGATMSSHAVQVDIRTARVHDLGPAVAAFWIR